MDKPRGSLGVPHGIALYTASLLGAGLLVMPSVAFQVAGPASLLAWVGLLLFSCPIAFTFAKLGVMYPDAGGVSNYVTRSFGDRAGAVVAFWFVFALPFGAPATAIVGAQYIAKIFHLSRDFTFLIALGLLCLAGAASLAGVRLAGSVQLILVGLLVAVLIVGSVGALPHVSAKNGDPFFAHGLGGVLGACGVLFFTFAGWEAVAPLTQEFRDPAKNVRIVTLGTLSIVSVLYLMLASVSIYALGSKMNDSSTPVQELLFLVLPGSASWITGVLAAVLTYGAMAAYLTGAASMAAALGRDGWLPALFSQGHDRGQTPRNAGTVILCFALAVLGLIYTMDIPLDSVMTLASAMFAAVTLCGLIAGITLLSKRREKLGAGLAAGFMLVVLAGCSWAAFYPVFVAIVIFCCIPRRAVQGGSRSLVDRS